MEDNMRCEECGTEMMIDGSFYTYRKGTLVLIQKTSCHNKKCAKYGEIKEIVHPLPIETE